MDHDDHDPLELESADADSLMTALANVEKVIPSLLVDIKPVLAHLVSPTPEHDERAGVAAREAVERYMATLDKIQFILRQTVLYLRETRAAPSVLRSPPVDGLPRPLAATLRGPEGGSGDTLGLYGARVEAAALGDMLEAVRGMIRERGGVVAEGGEGRGGEGRGGDEEMS